MLDSFLRPIKDAAVTPLSRLLERRVSPSSITAASFVAGCACAGLLVAGLRWAALGLWILNRLLDGLDGVVARRTGRTSDFGAYLDIVLDFCIYAAIPIAMALRSSELALACALLLGAAYVNGATWMYLSAILEKRGRGASAEGQTTSVVMPAGIVEGSETIVLYTLMIVLPGWRPWLFLLAAGLILAGAALRFFQGLRSLRATRPPEQGRATDAPEGRSP